MWPFQEPVSIYLPILPLSLYIRTDLKEFLYQHLFWKVRQFTAALPQQLQTFKLMFFTYLLFQYVTSNCLGLFCTKHVSSSLSELWSVCFVWACEKWYDLILGTCQPNAPTLVASGKDFKMCPFWVNGEGCWHLIVSNRLCLKNHEGRANCNLDWVLYLTVSTSTLNWCEQCLVTQAGFVGFFFCWF